MAADPAAGIAEYQMATDVDKARAKKAYDTIRTMISKKDLNSDNLFEDLIAEKALEFDQVSLFNHFCNHVFFKQFADEKEKSAQDQLLDRTIDQVKDFKESDQFSFEHDEQLIKEEIQKIMEDCASDKAKGLGSYNQYEQDKFEKKVEEPSIVVK